MRFGLVDETGRREAGVIEITVNGERRRPTMDADIRLQDHDGEQRVDIQCSGVPGILPYLTPWANSPRPGSNLTMAAPGVLVFGSQEQN